MVQYVAETFAHCTLKAVSIEDAGDILQTFGNVHISFFSAYCFMNIACRFPCNFPVHHIMIYYTYLTFIAHSYIFYIFIVLSNMKIVLSNINLFRTVFALRTCSTAPYQFCQQMYCAQFYLMSV